MSDLVVFLWARLDEDVARAKEWAEPGGSHWPWLEARMLREVEAKRAILEAHGLENTMSCKTCDPDGGEPYSGRGWYPCYTLRQLAAVYSDHPDYDQEWKP